MSVNYEAPGYVIPSSLLSRSVPCFMSCILLSTLEARFYPDNRGEGWILTEWCHAVPELLLVLAFLLIQYRLAVVVRKHFNFVTFSKNLLAFLYGYFILHSADDA
jgi:hypothetical protein